MVGLKRGLTKKKTIGAFGQSVPSPTIVQLYAADREETLMSDGLDNPVNLISMSIERHFASCSTLRPPAPFDPLLIDTQSTPANSLIFPHLN